MKAILHSHWYYDTPLTKASTQGQLFAHRLTDSSLSVISLLSRFFLLFPPAADVGLPFLDGPAEGCTKQTQNTSNTTVDS